MRTSGVTRSRTSRSGAARPGAARPGAARPGAASNLRILGGTWRGRRLQVASGVRPTEARLREALFSIWRPRLADCLFLDLFAGSGAVGLEALSRGAGRAVFAESQPRVLTVLRRRLSELAPAPSADREASQLRRARLPGDLAKWPPEAFDLIFADPPYRFAGYEALLRRTADLVAAGGEMAIEHSARVEIADAVAGWRRHDRRRYGDSCLSFYRPETGAG